MRGRRIASVVVLATFALASVGCDNEDLDTGEAVPPATEVVTETTGGPGTEGDAAAGEALFTSAGCLGCHTLAAAGAEGTVGPNLDEVKPSVEGAVEVITNGRGGMPPFEGQLSEQEIVDVATFVAESASGG